MLLSKLRSRSRLVAGPLVLAGLGMLVRCSADRSSAGGTGGVFSTASGGTGNRMNTEVDISYGGAGGVATQETLNPLCGTGSCIPDDASGCDFELPAGSGGELAMAGASSFGGAAGQPNWAGAGPIWEGMAGLSANPGDLDSVSTSCMVSSSQERSCQLVGSKTEGQPCLMTNDCSPGLACVGEGDSGVCRQYCCRGTGASCSDTTYCTGRPLLGNPEAFVPVCVPTLGCSLLEPYPCPKGQECTCSGELACIVVRSDGKTACAKPGPLRAGDACDPDVAGQCGYGFVCSGELGCLSICSTQPDSGDCATGELCQTPPGFPAELGVCVGAKKGR